MTAGGKSAVTISDVARVAGVSRATASRALNDSPQVTERTRARVRAAVEETGFVMNARGRALAVGRSESIAILLTEPLDEMFSDPTFAVLLRGISDGLSQTPTMPVLVQAWSEHERRRALRQFERHAVDAIIDISPYVGGELLENLRHLRLPVVLCGQLEGEPYRGTFSTIYADDVAGAQLAARRILAAGRRRVAIINGPADNPAAIDRMRGYRAALGAAFRPELTVHGDWDELTGVQQLQRLLAIEPGIDGVCAGSDRIAVGVLEALRVAGRRVPCDVSVIGFDDHALAAHTSPPLTTIHQPLLEQGRRAAALALEMADGAAASFEVMEMTLVERATV